jgi:hypothetical protein
VNETMTYTLTLELEAGDYEYKYFSNAFGEGWSGDEWPGDPNRDVSVQDAMTIDDIWGVHPDQVSVPGIVNHSINVFPNPASSRLNIVSDENISEIRIYDMLGQLVFSHGAAGRQHVVEVSHLQNGIYIMQVHTINGASVKKIQIAK